LEENKKLFEKGKIKESKDEFKIISKNKPPVAGSIAWANTIF
jgi:hypothetical protein